MIVIYGLKNCDTCRKALKWLKSEGIEHEFKDIRTNGFTNQANQNERVSSKTMGLTNQASPIEMEPPKNHWFYSTLNQPN